jgi:hypothetical protein
VNAVPLDAAAQAQLGRNALRLLDAALQADAAQWAAEDSAAAAADPGDDGLPVLDLAAMDLGMLDGLDALAAPAAPDGMALRQALQALPPGLAPLTAPLSDSAFAQWLALYRHGDAAVVDLVTLARRLAP